MSRSTWSSLDGRGVPCDGVPIPKTPALTIGLNQLQALVSYELVGHSGTMSGCCDGSFFDALLNTCESFNQN